MTTSHQPSRRNVLKMFSGMPLLPMSGALSLASTALVGCGGGEIGRAHV
jgi:hypothetical protein